MHEAKIAKTVSAESLALSSLKTNDEIQILARII
jgi:hypothetical protein